MQELYSDASSSSSPPCTGQHRVKELGERDTYGIVGSLLVLVTLLVVGSLGLIGSALLVGKSLPLLTQDLADLTCTACE